MLLWIGLTLIARLVWLTPIVAMLLAAEYQAIVRWEEQLLESRLGDRYVAYAAQVPRWIPHWRSLTRVRHPSDTGDEATQGWRETFFSERGTLIAIAAGLFLMLIKSEV